MVCAAQLAVSAASAVTALTVRPSSTQRAGWVGGVQELVGRRGAQSEPGACGQFGLGWAMSKGPGPSTSAPLGFERALG